MEDNRKVVTIWTGFRKDMHVNAGMTVEETRDKLKNAFKETFTEHVFDNIHIFVVENPCCNPNKTK